MYVHTRTERKRRNPAGTNCEQFEPRHTAGPIRVYQISLGLLTSATYVCTYVHISRRKSPCGGLEAYSKLLSRVNEWNERRVVTRMRKKALWDPLFCNWKTCVCMYLYVTTWSILSAMQPQHNWICFTTIITGQYDRLLFSRPRIIIVRLVEHIQRSRVQMRLATSLFRHIINDYWYAFTRILGDTRRYVVQLRTP